MQKIRILSSEDVLSLMTIKDALEADEQAYFQKAAGHGSAWPMVFHEFTPGKADLDIKSGDLQDDGVFGFKLVSWFGENHEKGLPELYGTAMLFDITSGAPMALINAGALTGMRTGAAAAVGAKYLARHDAKSLLIVGTGTLAPYAAAATILACPTIESVTFVNPHRPENTKAKLNTIREAVEKLLVKSDTLRAVSFNASSDLEKATFSSDIIITATPARTPVIRKEWIRPGTHISCLGADMSGKQELESALTAAVTVFVDDKTQSLSVGECEIPVREGVITPDHIRGEIGEIIGGSLVGRTSETQITVFDSSGIALQDIACCAHLLKKAEENQIGTLVAF